MRFAIWIFAASCVAQERIDVSNVTRLRVAWTYRTGDVHLGESGGRPSSQQTIPLYVDGVLYVTSGFGRVIALEPDTGKALWSFDPKTDIKAGWGDFANRGVATWKGNGERRIYVSPIDARLFAIDAKTGKPCLDFGAGGMVDLRVGLRTPPRSKGEYQTTSPPVVWRDVVIIGSSVADGARTRMPSGEVRGFDARSGKLLWTWHPLPAELEAGGGNAWSLLSVDQERGLVYVPTGSPSPDYYGGKRPGDNRSANSVVALRAGTGEKVWEFQTVHHDVWDYDVASQPVLYGDRGVAVGSKTGHLFLLDRVTGKPVFGVEERAVPQGGAEGEALSPTQPFPIKPRALVPHRFRVEDVWGLSEADKKWCREQVAALRNEGIFTPPTEQGSLIFPGNVGGMHWGGAAFDARTGYLVVPTNRLPAVIDLVPREKLRGERQRKDRLGVEFADQSGTPFGMGRRLLMTPELHPCNPPPWGVLSAVDTKTGEIVWEVPLGVMPWAAGHPDGAKWGAVNLGGPVVVGGLVFIGASIDPYLRAFEVKTGKEVWKGALPASARATPMSFVSPKGKRFVVISANGHNLPGMKPHDEIVAFALGN